MAEINGFTLKAIKSGIGHDRAGWSGNLYLDGKKIGFIEDDGFGGPLNIEYPESQKQLVDETVRKFFAKYPDQFEVEEIFWSELYNLCLLEQDFKKTLKKGYKILLELNRGDEWKPIKVYYCMADSDVEKVVKKETATKYRVFKSLDDFHLAV